MALGPGVAGLVGVDPDHVDRGGGNVVLELGLGQFEVACPADPDDVGGLAHGALDVGPGGISGLPLRRRLLGAGAYERFVQFTRAYGDLAAWANWCTAGVHGSSA